MEKNLCWMVGLRCYRDGVIVPGGFCCIAFLFIVGEGDCEVGCGGGLYDKRDGGRQFVFVNPADAEATIFWEGELEAFGDRHSRMVFGNAGE